MDEAMLKSGQFPNVAIEAGSDPAEVMREHGREVIPDGEKYELTDSREKLEADIHAYCNPSGYSGTIGAGMERHALEWLDRQEAITRADAFEDGAFDCFTCDAKRELQERVDSLTAERDEWKAKADDINNHVDGLMGAICDLALKQPCTFDPETPYENAELVAKYIDELRAKAEAKSAKRAAAVERLKNKSIADSWITCLLDLDPRSQEWEYMHTNEISRRLIDLLTDNELRSNDGVARSMTNLEWLYRTSEHFAALVRISEDVLIHVNPSQADEWLMAPHDCGQIADMSANDADCVRNDGFMSEVGVSADGVDANDGDASNRPIGESVARKTAETAETRAAKCDMRDFDDSREKLEADAMCDAKMLWNSADECIIVIRGWLDRQAAITERECMKQATTRYIGWDCAECAEGLGKELDARCDPLKERIAELTAEVEKHRQRANDAERGVLSDEWYVARDRYEDDIAELTAERDQLSRDLTAEHALVVQFEHDNEELRHANNTLRASVAGLKMTVERFKARESRDTRQSG